MRGKAPAIASSGSVGRFRLDRAAAVGALGVIKAEYGTVSLVVGRRQSLQGSVSVRRYFSSRESVLDDMRRRREITGTREVRRPAHGRGKIMIHGLILELRG